MARSALRTALREAAIRAATACWTLLRRHTPLIHRRLAALCDDPGGSPAFQPLGTPHRVRVPMECPAGQTPTPDGATAQTYRRRFEGWYAQAAEEPAGVYRLAQADLWSPHGVVAAGGRAYPGAYPSPAVFHNPKYALAQILLPHRNPRAHHRDGFFLGGPWVHNYYNTLIGYLPRLALLDRLQDGADLPVIAMETGPVARIQEALEALERRNPIVRLGAGVHRFERLVLPHRIAAPRDISEMTEAFFDQALKPALLGARRPDRATRRLYISRHDTAVRRIANETDLAAALARLGFEILSLAGRTLAEQAALFDAAAVIVAPHGASLANLIFCRPGTRVLEVFHGDHISPAYHRIAALRGLHYDLFVGSRQGVDTHVAIEPLIARAKAAVRDA